MEPGCCPQCGALLSSEKLSEGLCPRCLLASGLSKTTDDPSHLIPPQGSEYPDRIGPYKILGTLGEGGMGVVYLAQQDPPQSRRVALKLIKLGLDTQNVLNRFESERQVLALMDHPNIAKVLDAGTSETGRPYFVMEAVDGLPITEFCDREGIDIRGRLELFVQVCDAIQHAHQRGVIHRDIKPSNVLVKTKDGRPVPQVIDFGVAKAINQRLTEKTLFTAYGVFIGTPEYTSPEQAEISVLDVDTRADVYSLGVLMYELLVGCPPFDSEALRRAGFDEMRRIIREVDPPAPSVRLSNLGPNTSEAAKRRHTDTRSLVRQLTDDLDWIALRALEKERDNRYASVIDFALDIRRYLNHEPVTARPPNAAYRLRKFIRRNRGARMAPVLMLSCLIAAILGISNYVKLRDARKESSDTMEDLQLLIDAWRAWMAGDVELAYALNSSRKMHVPSFHGGRCSRCEEPTPIFHVQILQQLVEKHPEDPLQALLFKDAVRGAIRMTNDYLDKGNPRGLLSVMALAQLPTLPDSSWPRLHRRGFVLTREWLIGLDRGRGHPERNPEKEGWEPLSSREGLTQFLEESSPEVLAGEAPDHVAEKTLREDTRRYSRTDPRTVSAVFQLARVLERQATAMIHECQFAEAAEKLQDAIDLRREATVEPPFEPGEDAAQLSVAESALGDCLLRLGRYEEAEPLLLRAFSTLQQSLGTLNALTQVALNRVISLYEASGRSDKAESYLSALPAVSVSAVREVDTIHFPDGIGNESGVYRCYSMPAEARSVWTFQDGTWCTTTDLDASNGLTAFEVHREPGSPLMTLVGGEVDPPREKLWSESMLRPQIHVGAMAWDPLRSRGLVFYKRAARYSWSDSKRWNASPYSARLVSSMNPSEDTPQSWPGSSALQQMEGTSIAVWSIPEGLPIRVKVAVQEEDPTILFRGEEPTWGSAALIIGGDLYSFACDAARTGYPCLIAKVPVEHAFVREQWAFYAGHDLWSASWEDAVPVLNGMPLLDVHWNPYLGKFLAIFRRFGTRKIVVAAADRVEGPWSDELEIDRYTTGEKLTFLQMPFGHAELSQQGGRVEYITFSDKGRSSGATWLIELTFR